jgi:hypothetical protein
MRGKRERKESKRRAKEERKERERRVKGERKGSKEVGKETGSS